MRVNGTDYPLPETISLAAFLQKENYPLERVAVEKNGAIIPKNRFAEEPLNPGDQIEICAFVGGG